MAFIRRSTQSLNDWQLRPNCRQKQADRPTTEMADALSVGDRAVRVLDSVTCRWNPEVPNGGMGSIG
jgi:hypothetical protein